MTQQQTACNDWYLTAVNLNTTGDTPANGSDMNVKAPETWDDRVKAFTTLFAPANRMSLVAREFATLKQDAKQSVNNYALKVTETRFRLLSKHVA